MELIFPRYADRKRPWGLVPPSPPAEMRHKGRKAIENAFKTWTGRILRPGTPEFIREMARIGSPGAMTGGMQNLSGVNTQLFGAAGPPNDAAAYWEFQANGNDSTSNAHNLTNENSITFGTPAKIGNAGNNYVTASQRDFTIANHADFNLSATDFTIIQWFYSTQSGVNQEMFSKASGSGGSPPFWDWQLRWNTLDVIQYQPNNTEAVQAPVSALSTSAWHFLWVTFVNSTGAASLVVDNGTAGTGTISAPGNTTGAVYVGRGGRSGFPNWFSGAIDSTGIYRRKLTAGELALFWNAGNGADPTF